MLLLGSVVGVFSTVGVSDQEGYRTVPQLSHGSFSSPLGRLTIVVERLRFITNEGLQRAARLRSQRLRQ